MGRPDALTATRCALLAAALVATQASANSGHAWEYDPPTEYWPFISAVAVSIDDHVGLTIGCNAYNRDYAYLEARTVEMRDLWLAKGADVAVPVVATIAGAQITMTPTVGMSGVGSALLDFSDAEATMLIERMREAKSMMTVSIDESSFAIGMLNYGEVFTEVRQDCDDQVPPVPPVDR